MIRIPLLASATLLAFAATCWAQSVEDAIVVIEDPNLNARYQAIIQGVRCLICENRSIAESPSGVAQDLKKLIRDMLLNGASDAEISAFLTARYGDSILYRPPLQPNTLVLWGGPFVLLITGAIVFGYVIRSRLNEPIAIDDDEGTPGY